MVTEYHVSRVQTLRAGEETLAEARGRLPEDFPRRSARRMTHLGTLMARVLKHLPMPLDGALVYGTTYAETRSLENYVDSFPEPSPLLFQASIHPSGVQQVFVHRRIPLGSFIPITGKENLIGSLLETAVLAESETVILCGGEEKGSWLLEKNKASPHAFAWTLTLSRSSGDSDGVLSIQSGSGPAHSGAIDHLSLLAALEGRVPLVVPRASGGVFRIGWT
jgi:hypothetical protein